MAASGSVHGDGEVDMVAANEVGGQAGEGWSDLDGEETATGQEIFVSRRPISLSEGRIAEASGVIVPNLCRTIPTSPILSRIR